MSDVINDIIKVNYSVVRICNESVFTFELSPSSKMGLGIGSGIPNRVGVTFEKLDMELKDLGYHRLQAVVNILTGNLDVGYQFCNTGEA